MTKIRETPGPEDRLEAFRLALETRIRIGKKGPYVLDLGERGWDELADPPPTADLVDVADMASSWAAYFDLTSRNPVSFGHPGSGWGIWYRLLQEHQTRFRPLNIDVMVSDLQESVRNLDRSLAKFAQSMTRDLSKSGEQIEELQKDVKEIIRILKEEPSWLSISESAFSFWDNNEDAVYDDM